MTIIASWGGNYSNVYIGLSEANSLIYSSIVYADPWLEADPRTQQAALMQAVRDIDQHQYIGMRYFYDQFLEFPRQIVIAFPWNRTWSSSTMFDVTMFRMQKAVERANIFQAMWILRNGGIDTDAENRAAGIIMKSEGAGPVRETTQYGRGAVWTRLCKEAVQELGPYFESRRIIRG